ncbi:MAG: 6-phosphogluconolactonase [Clostridia bacterium]|nr:6-phosphogluconolactonase [Clostridia bacterium]
MRTFAVDDLSVGVYDSRVLMGEAAARDAAEAIRAVLSRKDFCNMIFAAAPSQNEVLAALAADPSIPWEKIRAFHMDEYVGLAPDAPQGFGNFLREHLFDLVPFRERHFIDGGDPDPAAACARYAALLAEYPPDIVMMGIGENGHIAFNDPGVADFHDPLAIKPVPLDEVCRTQQVHDGCFASLELVPKTALTLTVPTLVAAPYLFCVVPAPTKAEAVKKTLTGPIGEACPATILRTRPGARMYLDPDSAALLG